MKNKPNGYDPKNDSELALLAISEARRHLSIYRDTSLSVDDRLAGLHAARGELFRLLEPNHFFKKAEELRLEYMGIVMNPDNPLIGNEREMLVMVYE